MNYMHIDTHHTHFLHGRAGVLVSIHHHVEDYDLEFDWHFLPDKQLQDIIKPVQYSKFPDCLKNVSLYLKTHYHFKQFYKGSPITKLSKISPLFQYTDTNVYRHINFYSDITIKNNLFDLSQKDLLDLLWSGQLNYNSCIY